MPSEPAKVPSAVTRGIRVTVETGFVQERSDPARHQFFFAYQITIANEGSKMAQLRTRHWVITDARGGIEEVRGDGVVGDQPKLEPGQSHTYVSFCLLRTPRGTMHGTYQMFYEDGSSFDAEIPIFALVAPGSEDRTLLN
jgi:ApaG protein